MSQPSLDAHSPIDWPALLAEHDRWLRTVAYSRLREREAVDDVMQEVALAAIKQAAPLSDASKAGGWLYRVVLRQALMYRRTCGRRRKLSSRFADRCRPPENDFRAADPLDWLLADERGRLVRQALEQMRPGDAQMLLLKYTENWTYRQIADRLGVSESAVETRLHRARERLRNELTALQVVETV